MTQHYFHFTLGPVQGFVAQARRTRDFWAGSFLLSWLSAVAMKVIINQGGNIVFPQVDPNYLNWLENQGTGEAPRQGCVPNRFKGSLAKVPADFKPEGVVASVEQAWQALTDLVWQQDLAHLGTGSDSYHIWQRQVRHFWEISWALSDDLAHSDLFDRRKNWRHYFPPVEPGVKCMMMDGWQELSGTATPNAQSLKTFWDALRIQSDSLYHDLREREYLCAIAFIKRRFARHFELLVADMPGNWLVSGWKVNPSVPSVTYIAAVPWLANVLQKAPESTLKAFHDAAKKLTQGYGEYETWFDQAVLKRSDGNLFWNSKNLDGNVFFETALQNPNIYPDQTQAQNVLAALKALRKSVDAEPVSPFYAVLMMDGDSLGKQMSDVNKQNAVSQALNTFTQGVNGIVEQHSGFLIYAGGDDVLALLPLEYALNCAKDLRQHYLKSCQDKGINSTLSGAIEYAHINMPLGKVLADAHQLLDDIAKEATGRDSIAVRVWKPGGQHLQWALPWEAVIDHGRVAIQTLADEFQQDRQQTLFSNSFFFHVEQRFALLNNNARPDDPPLFPESVITDLIVADYLDSGINSDKAHITLDTARQRIRRLLTQCYPQKRNAETGTLKKIHRLDTSALQLIRFLAQKGVENG